MTWIYRPPESFRCTLWGFENSMKIKYPMRKSHRQSHANEYGGLWCHPFLLDSYAVTSFVRSINFHLVATTLPFEQMKVMYAPYAWKLKFFAVKRPHLSIVWGWIVEGLLHMVYWKIVKWNATGVHKCVQRLFSFVLLIFCSLPEKLVKMIRLRLYECTYTEAQLESGAITAENIICFSYICTARTIVEHCQFDALMHRISNCLYRVQENFLSPHKWSNCEWLMEEQITRPQLLYINISAMYSVFGYL